MNVYLSTRQEVVQFSLVPKVKRRSPERLEFIFNLRLTDNGTGHLNLFLLL